MFCFWYRQAKAIASNFSTAPILLVSPPPLIALPLSLSSHYTNLPPPMGSSKINSQTRLQLGMLRILNSRDPRPSWLSLLTSFRCCSCSWQYAPQHCSHSNRPDTSDLSLPRNKVTVYPIQGEYSRDKLMLQRIRSYIIWAHYINNEQINPLLISSYVSHRHYLVYLIILFEIVNSWNCLRFTSSPTQI